MTYNYLESMKNNVLDYINDEIDLDEYKGRRDDLEQQLNDDLWTVDSVTGNGSGSYTFDNCKAREYVQADGMQYISDMCSDFGVEAEEIGKRFIEEDWEWFDVSIRCYLLGQAISKALDEIADKLTEDDSDEDDNND